MPSVQAVMMRVVFRAGSHYESGRSWGAHHLLEHVTHLGTQRFTNKLDIELYKEEHGIRANAWTSSDQLGYWFQFPRASLAAAFTLFSEIVFHPSLPESEIPREVNVISQEYLDAWSDPYRRYWQATKNQFYGKRHIYSRDALGQPDFLKSLSQSRLQTLHATFFQPQNMVISLAGNFSPRQALDQLSPILASRKNVSKTKLEIAPLARGQRFLWHSEAVDQVLIDLTWRIPGYQQLDLREELIFRLLDYLLGGSARSRLFRRLRMEKGLVYSTGCNHFFFPTIGEFSLNASASPANARQVLVEMKQILREITEQGPGLAELKRAQNYLNSQTLLDYDSVGGIAYKLANHLFYENRVISPEELIATSNSIHRKDLRRALKQYINLSLPYFTSVMSKAKPRL